MGQLPYALAAFDLDDTLLREDGCMSAFTRDCLRQAQAQGLRIALASGRPVQAMERIADELEMAAHDGFLITFNGAQIVCCSTGEQLYSCMLDRPDQLWLCQKAREWGAFVHVYDGSRLLTPQANEYTDIESRLTGLEAVVCPDLPFVIPPYTPKVLMMQAPARLAEIERQLAGQACGRFALCRSKPYFLECVRPQVCKGAALKQLCAHLRVPLPQTIAMGDSYNDLSMLQAAGVGVAMGNAPAAIREKADLVTDTCARDGAAQALCRLLQGEAWPSEAFPTGGATRGVLHSAP